MTADSWTHTLRQRLGLGRLLPLGDPGDGAWIAESAAVSALRRAVDGTEGAALGPLRIEPAPDAADPGQPAAVPPPSALPPGPLRMTAELTVRESEPIPTVAARLRAALCAAAEERLGLRVDAVDLRVTGFHGAADGGRAPAGDEAPDADAGAEPDPEADAEAGDGEPGALAKLARGAPGVSGLGGLLGRPVVIDTPPDGPRRVRVEIVAVADGRALDTARGVRAAVAPALPPGDTVAVLVTGLRRGAGAPG